MNAETTPRLLPMPTPTKWFGERVDTFLGKIEDIADKIPVFERRPFVAVPSNQNQQASQAQKNYPAHKYHDLIVRTPFDEDQSEVPVGVVSKKYELVQHKDLFDAAVDAMEKANIELAAVRVQMAFSEYRGRMALRFTLPQEFDFNPGDGYPMALRAEYHNSVDGSSRLWVALGWFRSVCSNSLILDTAQLNVSRIHTGKINVPALGESLEAGLKMIEGEKTTITTWAKTKISENRLIEFVDGPLRQKWGIIAAARTFHICTNGHDGSPKPPFRKTVPHLKTLSIGNPVAGAAVPAKTAYDVSQVLAWLAKERNDIQEQVERVIEIPELMGWLVNARN